MPVVVRGDQERIGQTHLEIDEPSQVGVWAPRVAKTALQLAIEKQARESADAMARFLEGTVQLTFEDDVQADPELASVEQAEELAA